MFEKMVESMRDSGKIIKCKDKACSSGAMEEFIRESILKTKNMDLENSYGKMVESTLDIGIMENSQEWVSILIKMVLKEPVVNIFIFFIFLNNYLFNKLFYLLNLFLEWFDGNLVKWLN